MSSRTIVTALAMTVVPVPASFGISSPPSTTSTVPVPWGSTASTAALSTASGRGTPILTSTCIASTGSPTALAMLNPLCHSASRSARTAALVQSLPRMSVPMPSCSTIRRPAISASRLRLWGGESSGLRCRRHHVAHARRAPPYCRRIWDGNPELIGCESEDVAVWRFRTPLRRKVLAALLGSFGVVLWVLAVLLHVTPADARDVNYPHIQERLLGIVAGGAAITGSIALIAAG